MTNSTMMFAGRADHAVIYWGFHTGILTPRFYPGGELGHLKDFTEPYRRRETPGRGLDANVGWSEGAVNLNSKAHPALVEWVTPTSWHQPREGRSYPK